MGYSHYVNTDGNADSFMGRNRGPGEQVKRISDEQWDWLCAAFEHVRRIAEEEDSLRLTRCCEDVDEPPVVNSEQIEFNAPNGCESCVIRREPPPFSFCKTRGAEYDVYVLTMFLLWARACNEDGIKASASSDGGDVAIEEARCVVAKVDEALSLPPK